MKVIEIDILTIEQGAICHAVNTEGLMEAGLAKQIRDKWPKVYETYVEDIPSLGEAQLVYIHSGLWVANLATQDTHGHDGLFTSYTAVGKCLRKLSTASDLLYFPWGFGCGLGGGDWNIVMGLLLRWVPDATICYFRRVYEG